MECLGYTQQSCGLGRQPAQALRGGRCWAALAWLHPGASPSPAGLLLLSLMEPLGSESCTQRALLQQGQPSRAVCTAGIHLELAKGL